TGRTLGRDKIILHIDDHKRRAAGIKMVKGVGPADTFVNARNDIRKKVQLVHRAPPHQIVRLLRRLADTGNIATHRASNINYPPTIRLQQITSGRSIWPDRRRAQGCGAQTYSFTKLLLRRLILALTS